MNQHLFNDWKKHPVSRIMFNLLGEHKEALGLTIRNGRWEVSNIGVLNRLQGQLNTLEMLQDIDGFFEEKLNEENKDEQQEA